MKLEGEIQTYLEALGMHPNDPGLEAVLDLPGPTTDTNEMREADGNVVFHLAARSSGTEFMFSHEQLVAVFLGTRAREAWGVHPRPDALIDGLSGTATRAEVRARFGAPVWESEKSDRFEAGANYLQFEYRDDRVEVVVAAIGEAEPGSARTAPECAVAQQRPVNPEPRADPESQVDPESPAQPAGDPNDLPSDLLLWRARQLAGESTPWDQFGVRFLDDGEQPAVLDTSSLTDEDRADPRTMADVEATRLTAELITWVAEDYEGDEGRWWGYWRGPANARFDDAIIVTLEPGNWFDAERGRSLSEALCVDFGETEEGFAELADQCRAAGVPIEAQERKDVPFWLPEQNPRRYREPLYQELIAQAASAPRVPAQAHIGEAPTTITGQLQTVIAALERPFEDEATRAAMALFGPPFERSEYQIGPDKRVYYSAPDGHAELIFENGLFNTTMIWIRADEERSAYVTPGALIKGVGPETTREEIRARFGDPQWSNDTADRFGVHGVFVRFEYAEGRVAKISAMLTVPG